MQSGTSDLSYQTPLFFASGDGDDGLIRSLLEHGADPNHKDRFGDRPICWVAAQGYEAIVKMLLDSDVDANYYGKPNQAPLLWAFGTPDSPNYDILRRNRECHDYVVGDTQAVVSLLLRYGADPNIMDDKGRGILLLVVEHGFNSKALVTQLLKAGSNPNTRDKNGRTPLMDATVRGMGQVVKALLESPNIERDASDIFGRTALMEATRRHKPRLVKLLSQGYEEALSIDFDDDDHEFEDEGDLICDICGTWAFREDAYHCSICDNDNFDICDD